MQAVTLQMFNNDVGEGGLARALAAADADNPRSLVW
jgi:hypothetical protein